MADIGAKISIDGEKQFRQELKNLTQQGKTLSAQMGALASSFDKADDKETALAKASDNLNAQIKNQQKIVDKLSDAVKKSAKEKGEDATETLKLKEQLAKAETTLNKMQGTTAEAAVGMDKLGKEEKTVATQSNTASEKISAMTIALGNLAADAIKEGIHALGTAVKKIAQYFIDATKGAAEFADEILTLSSETHLSTDALQEYKYMASLVDVELSTITGAVTKLTKNMSSAKDGTGAAAEAFAKLDISVTDSEGNLRSANSVFDEAITALGNIANDTERDALAMTLFGKSASELNPLISAGADTLEAYREEAHKVGYVLDEETLQSMGEVQNGFDRLGLAASSLKNQIGSSIGKAVLPYLEELVSAVQDFMDTGDMETFSNRLGEMLKKAIEALSKSLPKVLQAGSEILKQLIKGLISVLPELARTATSVIISLSQFLIENLPLLIETATQILLDVANALAEAAPTLIPAVVQCILTITQNLIAHLPDFIAAGISLISGLVEGLTSEDGLLAIIGAIPQIISGFLDAIFAKDNLGKIIKAGIDIMINLAMAIVTAIPELIAMIPEVCTAIWDAIANYDWIGLGKDVLTKLGDGFVQVGGTLLYNLKMAFNKCWEWLSGLGKQAWNWGKDLIQGFIDGITAWASHLWDEIVEIADGIAEFLHFSRPDKGPLKEYEKWMPDFMQGLADGISANAWRVQDAMEGLTGGMAMTGKTTNVDYGGVSINVYAAQNQDENAIARHVMAVMQNEYNAKKAVFA